MMREKETTTTKSIQKKCSWRKEHFISYLIGMQMHVRFNTICVCEESSITGMECKHISWRQRQ